MPELPEPYLTAIRRTLPDVETHDVDVLDGEGMVNDVVVVRAETVFRFPKDARARAIQRHEAQVVDVVRERVFPSHMTLCSFTEILGRTICSPIPLPGG